MPDTIRTRAVLKTQLFQDGQAAASISPQDARDLIESVWPTEATLTPSGAAIAWNLATSPVAVATLTDANTTITASNGETGKRYTLALIQGAGGSKAVTLAGCTTLGTPSWRTVAGQVNIVAIDVVGSTRYANVI